MSRSTTKRDPLAGQIVLGVLCVAVAAACTGVAGWWGLLIGILGSLLVFANPPWRRHHNRRRRAF